MSSAQKPSRIRRVLRRLRRVAGPTAAAGYVVADASISSWLELGDKDRTPDPVEDRWRAVQTRLGPQGPMLR